VPSDLKLSGDQETFTVTVTYDTQILYGKFDATWQIVLKAEKVEKTE
jgi:hypothetical protein